MTERQHTTLATILVIFGFFLLRLASDDIRNGAEGALAVRAQAINVFGDVVDQAPHAVAGLTTASRPPLPAWLTSISMTLLGPSAMGLRLGVVILATLVCGAAFVLGRRIVDQRTALFSVVAMASTVVFYDAARHTSGDIIAAFGCALMVLPSIVRMRNGLIGNALLALGTSIVTLSTPLAVIPASAAVIAGDFLSGTLLRRLPLTLLAIVIGLGVATPWYLAMVNTYGDQFWLAFSLPLTTESHVLDSWIQLIAGQPLVILSFLYVCMCCVYPSMMPERTNVGAIVVIVWYIVAMVLSPWMSSELVIVPATLVAAYAAETFLRSCHRRFVVVLMCLILAIAALVPLTEDIAVWSTAVISVIGATAFLPTRVINALVVPVYRWIPAFVVASTIVRCSIDAITASPDERSGVKDVAHLLLDGTSPQFTYLYHRTSPIDASNPQLSWYLAGWMNGWIPGNTYRPVDLPNNATSDIVLVLALAPTSKWIVYYHAGQPVEVREEVTTTLHSGYTIEYSGNHYTLFRKI